MNAEIKARIERLVSIYENRVSVAVVLAVVITCTCLSLFAMKAFPVDTFEPAKGDRAVATYDLTYYGRQVTQVVMWVDKDGGTHYATETPKLAGVDLPILVLMMINLGLAKAGYDVYRCLTGRYRRRLVSRFQYRFDSK